MEEGPRLKNALLIVLEGGEEENERVSMGGEEGAEDG